MVLLLVRPEAVRAAGIPFLSAAPSLPTHDPAWMVLPELDRPFNVSNLSAMADRSRYDSAMFWLAFGTAAAVIGLALMTIGVSRSPTGAKLIASAWFDAGVALLVVGAVLLLWALALFLSRRRATNAIEPTPGDSASREDAKSARDLETVRGYYAERSKLIDRYFEDKSKDSKPGK